MLLFLKSNCWHSNPATSNLQRLGSPFFISVRSKQQPVIGTTLLQHSECRYTAQESFSCRDSLSPRENNQESFLFLSHSPSSTTHSSHTNHTVWMDKSLSSDSDSLCLGSTQRPIRQTGQGRGAFTEQQQHKRLSVCLSDGCSLSPSCC